MRDENVYFCHHPGEEVRSVYAAVGWILPIACVLGKESAFPGRKQQIDATEGAAVAWELATQTVQRLGGRERISKMLSLDAVVSVFCAPSFSFVELFLIETDSEAEQDQPISWYKVYLFFLPVLIS